MKDDARTKLEYVEGLVASLRSDARHAELWAYVADVLLEAGQFEKSVRAFDMALKLDPKLHRAKIGLTIALELCDRDLTKRLPPEMRSVIWEVIQALETLVRGLKEGRRALFVDVHALRLQKQTFRRLEENPNDPDALFLRSAILARQGAFEEAIATLDLLAGKVDYPGAKDFRRQLETLSRTPASRAAKPRA